MPERICQEEVTVINGRENEIVETFSHPNAGVYAYKICDAQDRICIVPSEDVIFDGEDFYDEDKDDDILVDGKPVDVLSVYRDDDSGLLGYFVEFQDGSTRVVEHVDTRPLELEVVWR